jgi:FRG domain-containing protein
MRIGSWLELHERLFADSWDDVLGLHRSGFAFRRRWNPDDDLGTSLVRLGGDSATRLLDWTYSPFVALHFATAKRYDMDGAVWMVDYGAAHEQAPPLLGECLEEEGADVFTTEMLGRVASGLRELGKLGDDFVVFVEPRRSTSGSSINTPMSGCCSGRRWRAASWSPSS